MCPHLENAQVVWAPHLIKHVNIIENVQKCATKRVGGLSGFDYTTRLKKLDLPTLLYRRARGDMIELYKHFHHYDKTGLVPSFRKASLFSMSRTVPTKVASCETRLNDGLLVVVRSSSGLFTANLIVDLLYCP